MSSHTVRFSLSVESISFPRSSLLGSRCFGTRLASGFVDLGEAALRCPALSHAPACESTGVEKWDEDESGDWD